MSQRNDIGKNLMKNLAELTDLDNKYQLSFEEMKRIQCQGGENSLELFNKEYSNWQKISDNELDISNASYMVLDEEITKVNHSIDLLEKAKEKTNNDSLGINNRYSDYLKKKYMAKLVEIDAYYNTKRKMNRKKCNDSKQKDNIIYKLDISLKKKNEENTNEVDNDTKDIDESIKAPAEYLNDPSNEDITYKEILQVDKPITDSEFYCYCNFIGEGQMIQCDNVNCLKKWFHYKCVGLTALPKQKWFCSPECFNTA